MLGDQGSIPGGGRDFFLRHRVRTGSGAHPASYPMVTGGYLTGFKRPGRETDNSRTSSAEVKNAWSYASTPHVMARYLVKYKDNFTFTLPFHIFHIFHIFILAIATL
jgi:hypothetical protein